MLDPFSGSGTVGVAALAHGCAYAGIEQMDRYVELQRRRFSGGTAQRHHRGAVKSPADLFAQAMTDLAAANNNLVRAQQLDGSEQLLIRWCVDRAAAYARAAAIALDAHRRPEEGVSPLASLAGLRWKL